MNRDLFDEFGSEMRQLEEKRRYLSAELDVINARMNEINTSARKFPLNEAATAYISVGPSGAAYFIAYDDKKIKTMVPINKQLLLVAADNVFKGDVWKKN